MTTLQGAIAQHGASDLSYTLEFRTWNGSAYVWTDYTSRLIDFSGIGSTVEDNAFPNAFRMNIGRVELDNIDAMFNNIDALDGLLYNSSEPYGQSIYKRMLRIKCNGTAIGVALVRDVKPRSDRNSVIIETISLDARASDQKADGKTAERHPLGSTDRATPSTWTATQPASLTANVNMYRWREEEADGGQVTYGWFKDRHYAEIIERTAWALDDLATDITKSFRLMTADGREIATTRNIPPNDATVSTGVTTDRCRVVIWNPERNVLVCCIGHFIYDYDPTTNTYTLRNTLTAGRDVVRAFYTTEADSNGKNKRIVLMQCDINTYANDANRVASAWCTVLDATGSGAYTVLCNQLSVGTDVFPGTHMMREGTTPGVEDAESWIGRFAAPNPAIGLENSHLPFKQEVNVCNGGGGAEALYHGGNTTSIFDADLGSSSGPPEILERGWLKYYSNKSSSNQIGLKYSLGGQFACSLNIYNSGGRLYFFTWDSTNGYRLKYFNLTSYTDGVYLALGGASTRVPYFAFSPQDATYKRRIYVCQMNWVTAGTTDTYSTGQLYYYDFSTSTWTQINFLSGATGSNQAWMVMECIHHTDVGVTLAGIIYNRETLKWRFCYDLIGVGTWASTDAACLSGFLNGQKDQDNRLEGLFENTNYSPDRLFFVEAGPNLLWSYTSTLNKENVTSSVQEPINSDRGLGSFLTASGANWPDSGTPNGVMFWVSANDYLDAGTDHPEGRYVLCQYANFDAGFIELLDVSGLSFWELRTQLAEAFGYVHYYAPDGTLTFKPRTTSGAASFTFSDANRNYLRGEVVSRGFEAILNEIIVKPYAVTREARMSEIIKGYNEASADKDGMLDDVLVSSSPGENSQWRLVFVSTTTYDLYKLQGANASASTPKKTGQSIASPLQGPTDGAYLSITPEHFTGTFVAGDNFTFWVLEPDEKLEALGDADLQRSDDATSIAKYKRVSRTFDNRFIRRQIAIDYAQTIRDWRAVRHDVVRIEAAGDPAYLPLLRCTLTDTNMGFNVTTFQIMGVEHRKIAPSRLTLVKI